MRGEKLTTAINGVKEFVTAMDREDELLWMPFSDRVYEGERGLKSAIGEKLLSSVSGTVAEGDTALYDAIFQAYNTLKERRGLLGDSKRYGIVVLSDGVDTSSKRSSLATIQSLLKATEGDASSIQIHTIGIGEDADKGLLTQLANMAHGRYWDARNPKNTTDIYRQIAVHARTTGSNLMNEHFATNYVDLIVSLGWTTVRRFLTDVTTLALCGMAVAGLLVLAALGMSSNLTVAWLFITCLLLFVTMVTFNHSAETRESIIRTLIERRFRIRSLNASQSQDFWVSARDFVALLAALQNQEPQRAAKTRSGSHL